MLTEKEAWLFLAEKWANPAYNDEGDCCVTFDGKRNCGICGCVWDLHHTGQITEATLDLMNQRVQDYRIATFNQGWYLWPTDDYGAELRSEFCKTQAEKL